MNTPKRIALIGAGNICWDVYLEDLSRRPELALAAVVARSPETRQRVASTYRIGEQFESVEELLEFGDFDQAFVLTPPEAHHHQVKALLGAGHDVLCEKPVAPSLAEVRDLEEVQQATGRVLLFAFNRRYCPVYLRARAAFAERRPDVCLVQKNKEATQRRALLNDAIHVVDAMRWFCGGEVEDVQARALGDDPHFETNVTASVRFSTGALGVFVMSRTAGGVARAARGTRLEPDGCRRLSGVRSRRGRGDAGVAGDTRRLGRCERRGPLGVQRPHRPLLRLRGSA